MQDRRRSNRESRLARVRYKVAASVDGYVAHQSGGYDWIHHDPEVNFAALFDEFDILSSDVAPSRS